MQANSGDPGQTPRSAASDLGLHCLSMSIILFVYALGRGFSNVVI